MKSLLIKGALITLVAMMTQTNVSGQQGQWGKTPEDSIRALRNLSLFGDRHRQGNYEGGLPFWRVLFKEFPRASINIYIWGEPLMTHMINKAKTDEEKQAYLDTAMMMFDQRMEHFGDRANVLGRKGLFYFQHNRDISEAGPGYEALEESVRLAGDKPSPAVVHTYMNVTVTKYQAGVFDSEKVIETYSNLMENLDRAYARTPNEQLLSVRGMVETLFAESGAADCDALISLFGGQVEKSPNDMELLGKVNDLLTKTNCNESDLYLTVTEKLHEADPSPRTALNLSAMYNKRNNDAEAVRYIKEAIELQDDPVERANYYLDLAFIANQVNRDKQLSRQYAQEALKNNPSLGRAHLHIGNLYASETSCFDDPFKNRTVYWVAVDRFNDAKRVDPTLTTEANRLIETYSPYFPDMETIFFNEFKEGESYRVQCWINETTRIRARK